ncbi:MAG: NlpC/P60 family protein [Micropruina sp.]|uniref:C40 family peptidase n=1 Tax=Micropruina sp. TaxID=2737536 RepID=UPI0039E6CCE9
MRLRAVVRSGLAALATATVLIAGPVAQAAFADPALDDAKARLTAIEQQQSEIGEEWAEVKLQLAQGKAKVETLNADIAAQQLKVDALRTQAQQVAVSRFQNRGVDITIQLVTSSDPDGFLSDMSTMGKVDQNMNSLLQEFQAQQADLADLQRAAHDQLTAITAEEQQLASLKSQIDEKIREAQALVDQLTEQERQRLNAEEAASDEVVGDGEALIDDSGPADERALRAVKYAVSKVPTGQYVWGAEGPNEFDCSGLMLAAYRSVGVSLPHSSRAQSTLGRPVARDQLKPGDLLFFYSPIHHVGMYMGNGLFVHARNPRNDLEITKLSSYPAYQGARRILG